MSEKSQAGAAAPARRGRTGTAAAIPDGATSPFDAEALEGIKQSLLGQLVELENQLRSESQAFSSSESEIASEIRSDENPAEAGTATFEREKHLSIAQNVQDLLEKSRKALNKITHGTYGTCEVCGKPIALERLKALPHALMCIECKKSEERR